MSQEPIYRTVFTVEVFSEGPYFPRDDSLEGIAHEIMEGDCIGNYAETESHIVLPELLADELLRIGNDGEFFDRWDDDGEVIVGDEVNLNASLLLNADHAVEGERDRSGIIDNCERCGFGTGWVVMPSTGNDLEGHATTATPDEVRAWFDLTHAAEAGKVTS